MLRHEFLRLGALPLLGGVGAAQGDTACITEYLRDERRTVAVIARGETGETSADMPPGAGYGPRTLEKVDPPG